VRIIAGTAGGIRLQCPSGEAVRPTTDRVRQSLFSILGDRVVGATVLDLFAGTGSLGIECLSRGATQVTFVESHRATARLLEENLRRAKLTGEQIVNQPVEAFFRGQARSPTRIYDLILADPPYATREGDIDYIALLLQEPALPGLLHDEGLLVMEVPRLQARPNAPAWELRDARTYGTNQLWFLVKVEN
jgi:16S rRNA (guanine966-N2)-methyltransferase